MISEQIITFWFAILYRVCTMHIAHLLHGTAVYSIPMLSLFTHTHTVPLRTIRVHIQYIPQMEIFWQLCMHISFSVHLSLSLRRRSIPIPARWRSLRRDERFPSDLSGPGKLFIGGELSSW